MTHQKLLNAGLELADGWPQLLAQAQSLANSFVAGGHGRRRAGVGDTFWQFRPAQQGDNLRDIDWRRTARGDDKFVRQNEWQAAQSIQFWVDGSASMQFSSSAESKHYRAACVSLALAILLTNAGERVGTVDGKLPTKQGRGQVEELAKLFSLPTKDDFGSPEIDYFQSQSLAVFVSDFFGDITLLEKAVTAAANLGVSGVLLMILDPEEISFPFSGRTVFESMAGEIRHESQQAGGLKSKYQTILKNRQAILRALAKSVGWQFHCDTTGSSPADTLIWLHRALEHRR